MSSQSGNSESAQGPFSGHSFMIATEAESNASTRNSYTDQASATLPSDMGLRYMTLHASDDTRFSTDSGTPQNAVYSDLPAAPPSQLSFPQYSNVFHPGLSGPTTYGSTGSSFFSPNTTGYCMPDIKPHLGYHGASDIKPLLGFQSGVDIKPGLSSFSSSPIMAPPSRSPHLPHLGSPSAREIYTNTTPQLRRASDLISRSPSTSGTMRGVPLSPSSSSGFASPANNMDSSLSNAKSGPPLQPTEILCTLQSSDGQTVRPDIHGKIDKGFFMADNDWTCYRRNYFQLSCSYSLNPMVAPSSLHVIQNGTSHQIHGFSMSIGAVVDGHDGKAIELVQHTPKRDKGPQMTPDRVPLAPRPHPTVGMYGSGAGDGPGTRSMYDPSYGGNSNQQATETTFERIQFKQATANNGKRRAAQQYYHLLVELYVDIGAQNGENRWIKIAQRVSAPMVVRGRSPGHYHADERRQSNASAGGSGSAGGGYGSGTSISRGPGDPMALSTSSSMLAGNSYVSSYENRSHNYLSSSHGSHIDTPMDPIMSSEEVKAIDESDGYLYYPAPLFEGTGVGLSHSRSHNLSSFHRDDRLGGPTFQLPNPGPKIKQEFGHGHGGYSLPSLTANAPVDSLGRHCGRFEGLSTSRGYFPTVYAHSEINTS